MRSLDVSFYQQNGYVVLEDVLTDAEVQRLNGLIDDAVAKSGHLDANDDMYDLEPGHSAERPRVRGLRDPLALHPMFKDVSVSPRVLDPVERLIGRDIRHDLSFVNIKPAGCGSPVEWHQDFAILPYTNDDLLVCGLCLTDSTRENGCLQVIPGSHRGPILDHHQDDVMIGAVPIETPGFDLSQAVALEAPAGAMTIHHFRVLHGSAPNRSLLDRRVYFLDYGAADAFPVGKKVVRSEFDARIVRGEPSRTCRMMPLEFLFPNRRRKADVLFHLQEGLRHPVYAGVEPNAIA